MREITCINDGWKFSLNQGEEVAVDLPHTWNASDGQDGGNDYFRGKGVYTRKLSRPVFDPREQAVYLEFEGVNASAQVYLNDVCVMSHDGGYSTFRADVTEHLGEENILRVEVDNSVNDRVYPQKADFTFYGGIYRDVKVIVLNRTHFAMDYYGTGGIQITPKIQGRDADISVVTYRDQGAEDDAQVQLTILDRDGKTVAEKSAAVGETVLKLVDAHLWNGVEDPYLYTMKAQLIKDGIVCDEITCDFGVRSFSVDPDKGFFLNGRHYPLYGVSRHQDFKGIGNAITKEHHDHDMELIKEIGANTIRLAHYQHDQYFYDLCDREGMVVWAEIPYISEHMPAGRANTISQMKELIVQNYNHPCIVTWGLSNEITISTKNTKDMLDNHRELNDLVHRMDPTRPTSLACYAMCNPFARVVHISDLVSYNLYLGWYVPGFILNDIFLSLFHLRYPKRCIGYSEYGAEGMPNLHSEHPRRGDHTEEYQAKYHEYMIKCFKRHPFMWATHIWNMFDFAADARDQGGEPGMNHKGLVTFDRKTKKDSFYLYKAYWNPEPMVHICGKRFEERGVSRIQVKVYSNQDSVTLKNNGKTVGTKQASGDDKVFVFDVELTDGENHIDAEAGSCADQAVFKKVANPRSYKLEKKKSSSANWV